MRTALLRADMRPLTLVGPPGIGNTRLSVQVASELRDALADGVFFVALAPIRDPQLVAATIAQTLVEQLKGYLRENRMLLCSTTASKWWRRRR